MFNKDFYPTPVPVIEEMLSDVKVSGKVILEPSAGKGDIVDYLKAKGAREVIACEKHDELRKIVSTKCKVIGTDFLQVTSEQVSHIDVIVMNPPFSADEHHILHAYEIAPAGCTIVALCNMNTLTEVHNRFRRQLKAIISEAGNYRSLGNCFDDAERRTGIEIGLVQLKKAGGNQDTEFEGFFMEEEVEEQGNGIISYNFIRDLVNRYVGAVKIYDEQLEAAVKMNALTSQFFTSKISLSCTEGDKPKLRNDYKKDLQKAAWKYIFDKMNMEKYTTKGLKEEMNRFVENQEKTPFTMRNIYKMLEIIVGTHAGRMDQALTEVFDKVTKHTDENRYNVEGWKTNSHYLLNEKFIMGWIVGHSYSGGMEVRYGSNDADLVQDMCKALCFITGKNYGDIMSLEVAIRYRYKLKNRKTGLYLKEERGSYSVFCMADKLEDWSFQANIKSFQEKDIDVEIEDSKPEWGKWFDWGFFEVRGYKKGTMHFKFKDREVWAKFNQHIARIKGYPLFEQAPSTNRKAA